MPQIISVETILFWRLGCDKNSNFSSFTLEIKKSFNPKQISMIQAIWNIYFLDPLMAQFWSEDFEGFHIVPEGLNKSLLPWTLSRDQIKHKTPLFEWSKAIEGRLNKFWQSRRCKLLVILTWTNIYQQSQSDTDRWF